MRANLPLPFEGGQRDLRTCSLVAAGGGYRPCAKPMAPAPTPPLKGRGYQAATAPNASSASLAAIQRTSAPSCAATILPRRCDSSLIVRPIYSFELGRASCRERGCQYV